MRLSLIALLLLTVPAFAYDYRYIRYQPGNRRVIRTGGRYLGRGYSRNSFHRNYYGSRRDQSWRLHRVRRPWANQDPYSYGRCYWRGYYRPYLYCRQYKPRYSFYQSIRRYPQPGGMRGPSYPQAFARPPFFAGPFGGVGWGGGVPGAFGGYGYGSLYQSRYGYRHPHAYVPGGAGPYGFADPWGYRLLPAFDFAPILTRLTTVFTIDDPAFDGDEPENADGLPQPRTGPVGKRFLTPTD
ncbi:MAG: hypothetical protein ACYS0F_16045 [Planctomycetota bacterium]|jgi:hypothetical protein